MGGGDGEEGMGRVGRGRKKGAVGGEGGEDRAEREGWEEEGHCASSYLLRPFFISAFSLWCATRFDLGQRLGCPARVLFILREACLHHPPL